MDREMLEELAEVIITAHAFDVELLSVVEHLQAMGVSPEYAEEIYDLINEADIEVYWSSDEG